MTLFEDAYVVIERENIAYDRIYTTYKTESALEELQNSVTFLESDAEPSGSPKANKSFKNFINSIVSKIMKVISDVKDKITSIFNGSNKLTLDEYLDSETGELALKYDIVRIQQNAEAEVRKGRKLVQAISRGTKVDDRVVEAFLDGGANLIDSNPGVGRTVIKATTASVVFNKCSKSLDGMKRDIDATRRECLKELGKEKEGVISRIFTKMGKITSEASNYVSITASSFTKSSKEQRTIREQQEKEAKKAEKKAQKKEKNKK